MATVRKRRWQRSDGSVGEAWLVRATDQLGRRTGKTFAVKADADKYVRLLKKGNGAGTAASYTVADACRLYCRSVERRYDDKELGRTRLLAIWSAIDLHIVPLIGQIKLHKLTPLVIDAFIDRLRREPPKRGRRRVPRSAFTIESTVSILRGALTEAQRQQIIARNVLKEVPPRKPKVTREQIQVPSKDDLRKIIRNAEGEDRLILKLALFTGMRAGEICALTWNDIEFERSLLRVRKSMTKFLEVKETKTPAGRRDILIPPDLLEDLEEHRNKNRSVYNSYCRPGNPIEWRNLIFISKRRNGQPRQPVDLFHSTWKPACKRAGLCNESGYPIYHFHSLRHCAASLFIEQGLPPKRVQTILGHSSIKMTFDTYGHLFPDDGATLRASLAIAAQFAEGEAHHGDRS